ncbi:putative cytochrome P450 [Xylariaceae sp. FL0804]|nr:putative cytochrome P450 [Xylariaceae sp. FL0804]
MALLDTQMPWTAILLAAVCSVIAMISSWWLGPKLFPLPIVGAADHHPRALKLRYVQEADALLREGYEQVERHTSPSIPPVTDLSSQFGDSIFQVLTPDGPRIFLPRKYAHELKGYRRHEASGMQALADRHLGHYTTISHESDIMLGAIKIDLNRNLGTFVGDVEDEVAYCFETQFPPCDDWTRINLHAKLLRVVAQASARVFVGYPLCRNEEWLDCSTRFADDAMLGGEKLKRWHPYLRPIAQYLVPEMTRIRGNHQRALELLLPELERRAAEQRDDENASPPPRNDMIAWMQQRARRTGDTAFDDRELAKLQMLTATAAIHTTRLAITHALYDLAARPEYIQPLREEILEVTRGSNGVLRKQHLTQMKKLDSFMKESQRLNPPSVATFQRKATRPIVLSNGFRIPRGVVVQCSTQILDETPAAWMEGGGARARARDDDDDPHAFDGFRFHRLRGLLGDDADAARGLRFASPSLDSLQFGLGPDACPGRFFAAAQIKIVLAHVLRCYDVALALKGDGTPTAVGRPKNLMFEVNVLPDPDVEVLFRRVRPKAV